MSVINQMLQDLDKRQHQPLEPVVIGSSKSSVQSMNKVLLGVVIILALITITLAAIWVLRGSSEFNQLDSVAKTNQLERQTQSDSSNNSLKAQTQPKTEALSEIQHSSNVGQITATQVSNQKNKSSEQLDPEVQIDEVGFIDSNHAGTPEQIPLSSSQSAQSVVDVSQQEPELEIADRKQDKQLQRDVNSQPGKESVSSVQRTRSRTQVNNTQTNNTQVNNNKSSMSLEPIVMSKEQLAEKKRLQLGKAKQEENMKLAIQLARELYQLSPRNVDSIKEYAALLYASEDLALAEDLLRSSLAHDDESASLRLMLAKFYYHKSDIQTALNTLDGYRGSVIKAIDLISFRAALNQKNKNAKQAHSDYSKLIVINPNQGAWMLGLAITSEQIGQNINALQAYQKARSIGGLSSASKQFIQSRISALGGQ
jgi:MSHA biogenesis protein MshN